MYKLKKYFFKTCYIVLIILNFFMSLTFIYGIFSKDSFSTKLIILTTLALIIFGINSLLSFLKKLENNNLINKTIFKIKDNLNLFNNNAIKTFKNTETPKNTNVENNNENNIFNDKPNETNWEAYDKIEKKYNKIITKHFQLIEQIGIAYTIANNLSLPNSPEMQKVIDLCLEDINLAPTFSKYCKELSSVTDYDTFIRHYPSFSRLAIIYEKQGEYQKAIDICKLGISLGFYKDGTAGQLPGRIARLIKKARKNNIQINE